MVKTSKQEVKSLLQPQQAAMFITLRMCAGLNELCQLVRTVSLTLYCNECITEVEDRSGQAGNKVNDFQVTIKLHEFEKHNHKCKDSITSYVNYVKSLLIFTLSYIRMFKLREWGQFHKSFGDSAATTFVALSKSGVSSAHLWASESSGRGVGLQVGEVDLRLESERAWLA